jgi:beta-lactam-binding protein with PASTA domain
MNCTQQPRLAVASFLAAILALTFYPGSSAVSQVPSGSSVDPDLPAGIEATAAPVVIGTQSAGSFADATGHSGQSHLVYAANAGVWWLFTLPSATNPDGTRHHVKAYRSTGSDLATTTWTPVGQSPEVATGASSNCGSCFMGGGRALSVAYVNNAPTDVVHVEVAMAADGANGLVAHIRATVTPTSINWAAWNYHDEGAATWTTPRATAIGVSTGKFIHTGGPILQQQVDANARKSNNADIGATWTSGFSSVSVIDNSMIHASNAIAFAPLADNAMLAVYDNGGGTSTCYNCGQNGVPEPKLTNLGFKKSNANGSWPGVPVGGQGPGDGYVFSSDAIIDQNDWALVSRDTTTTYVFRSNAAATGIDAAEYDETTNTWTDFAPPPLFGPGQSLKQGAGVFGVASGANIWLFVVNTDTANSILQTTYDGTAWTSWTTVPGTEAGQRPRKFISGFPVPVGNQIGLIWTEGSTPFDVVVMAFPTDQTPSVPNVVDMTQAAAAQAITNAGFSVGTVTTASSPTVPIDSVISQSPLPASEPPLGSQVDLVVSSGVTVPLVVGHTEAAAAAFITDVAGLTLGAVTTISSATVPAGIVISQNPAGDTNVSGGSSVALVVSAGLLVPNVFNFTEQAATTAITDAGLVRGAVTNAPHGSVAAGSVISQNPAGGTPAATGSAVDLVISTGPVLSSPTVDAVVFSDGAGTRLTSAFSTAVAGEVLLAFASSDGPQASRQTVTVSGAGLTWTLVRRANVRPGTVEIWQAKAAAKLTNVRVQSVQSIGGYRQSFTVVAFRGATGIGASAIADGSTGAPTVSLVTTSAKSLVYGVGDDPDRAVARTLGAGQTMVHQRIDTSARATFWVQRRSTAAAAAGSVVTLNDTAPTNDRWNFASVEVVP